MISFPTCGPIQLNSATACAAAGAAAEDKVEAAQRFVLQYAQTCVVSLGARGCVARAKDGAVARAPAGGVKVVDTIGAGDYFTSGFLYAHLMGCSLQQCAAVGCQAGSEAVKVKGSILSEQAWQSLRSRVDEFVGRSSNPSAQAAAGSTVAAVAAVAAAATEAVTAVQHEDGTANLSSVDASCVLTAA